MARRIGALLWMTLPHIAVTWWLELPMATPMSVYHKLVATSGTANVMGVAVPPALMVRAKNVIE